MIAFSNVTKQYGGQILFVDASFQVNPGERVGLVGPNGAGKTTIFRLIIGQETPDDGSVERPRKLTIGYFNQDISGLRGRTVLVETVAGAGEVADLGTEMRELEDQMASGCEDLDAVVAAVGDPRRVPLACCKARAARTHRSWSGSTPGGGRVPASSQRRTTPSVVTMN